MCLMQSIVSFSLGKANVAIIAPIQIHMPKLLETKLLFMSSQYTVGANLSTNNKYSRKYALI